MTGSDGKMLTEFKKQMRDEFEMFDLGDVTYFLGLEVFQSDQGIFISQKSFSLKILSKFCMENCKPGTPNAQGEKFSSHGNFEKYDESNYRSLIGCLLYLKAPRLNIMFFCKFAFKVYELLQCCPF